MWAIPISAFILYVFCSLKLLAEEIEDPFEKMTMT
jgi:predicted membrane chloride channel (bestrophin family)